MPDSNFCRRTVGFQTPSVSGVRGEMKDATNLQTVQPCTRTSRDTVLDLQIIYHVSSGITLGPYVYRYRSQCIKE